MAEKKKFEDIMAELNRVVEELEQGSPDLDRALASAMVAFNLLTRIYPTLIKLSLRIIDAILMPQATTVPITVAMAAPLTPMGAKPKWPKIRI